MHSPFFTIIIPSYNSEKTLQNALDSILHQEFTDLEVVIIDGLSVDDTLSILKENSEKDHRVRFVYEKDKGIYDAMNKGIVMAKGKWLYFMGSDDSFFDKNVLQKIANILKNSYCDFLYGKVYSAKIKGLYGRRFNEEKILFSNICHQAIFYKKEIHEYIGFYNIQYTSFADWDINIRCFLNKKVEKQYANIVVANFATGGESTVNPDIFFLRDYLFSKNLRSLNIQGAKKLNNIKVYDKWWRLIRSLRLMQHEDGISKYANGEHIPAAIEKMVSFQLQIPYKFLRIGIVSKILMSLSYFLNLIRCNFNFA